jgi:alpha,alpha-trehalose phosphorylase
MIVPWDEAPRRPTPAVRGASPSTEPGDFENTVASEVPLLLHYPYFDLYRKQVVKQADLVLALHARG